MRKKKESVLLVTEGTYPFMGGGVSTWAHHLTQRITAYDFSIYSLNADVVSKPKFDLGSNVREVLQVPVWAPEEPFDCVDYNQEYSRILTRREITGPVEIETLFIPSFRKFLYLTFSDHYLSKDNIDDTIDLLKQMWEFFEMYDYKTTMASEQVWYCFRDTIDKIWPKNELDEVKLIDFTMSLRLIYRYLMPLAIDVPKSDLTHLTIAGVGIIPALKQKLKYGAPIVLTEHGVFIRERLIAINNTSYSTYLKKILVLFSEMFTRITYRASDKIISVSKFNIKWEMQYGADIAKIEIIHNGVDSNIFVPKPNDSAANTVPTVVAAARIFELKDIMTMIRACAEVRKKIPNVLFLVYGNKDAVPEYTAACIDLIHELNLSSNFKLAGFHSKPHELFLEGDISILTSISEGFPFTVIESMSCGIPVVATDVGGISEAIEHGKSGFLCKPKDQIAIGESVIELLQNKELRKQMSQYGRNKVLQNFTINKFTNAFFNVYYAAIHQNEEHNIHSNQIKVKELSS